VAESANPSDKRVFTDVVAESSWRYLYTRLGPSRFQELCGALLVSQGKGNVECMPPDQADGGRDVVDGATVYQCKWAKYQPKDPVKWLAETLSEEQPKIAELVQAGRCREYVLMTNVAGTARLGSGTIDRISDVTRELERRLSIPVKCLWQNDLDAAVDGAPDAIKWSFIEMLAGIDLFRCLTNSGGVGKADRGLRDVVTKVSAFQWAQDAAIKFEQVDLRKQRLSFLYVDCEAQAADGTTDSALATLLDTRGSVLVYGAPGQGKSTLAQALCQLHRVHFLRDGTASPEDVLHAWKVASPLLPLRLEVRNYAHWLSGGDPFDTGRHLTGRPAKRPDPTVETFLAHQLKYQSGGAARSTQDVHALLEKFRCLIVFDGLDEVGSDLRRDQVVAELDAFMQRHLRGGLDHRVIITTRPNAVGLAEPDHPDLSRVRLLPLDLGRQRAYLGRWADVRELDDAERSRLSELFEKRSRTPHVAQLANNPMQLAILLYLIHTMGESVPDARTLLYEAYVEKLLVREGMKSKKVVAQRLQLIDVTSYLGWQIHSVAESTNADGRLRTDEIRDHIRGHLTETGQLRDPNEKSVNDLFTSATQRVWTLASKSEGTFEFDVQSIREYFAAKYLFEYAGANAKRGFDRGQVLRELLKRPYWLNVLRFYAGFLPPADLRGAVLSIEEEFQAEGSGPQARVGAWLLIADGALAKLPLAQQRAVELLAQTPYNRRILYHFMFQKSMIAPLPAGRGGTEFAVELMRSISAGNRGVDAEDAALLAAHLPDDPTDFDEWWHRLLRAGEDGAATGRELARDIWAFGVPYAAGSRVPDEIMDDVHVDSRSAGSIVASGVRRGAKGLEEKVLRACLAGWASGVNPAAQGHGPDLLRAVSPAVISPLLGERVVAFAPHADRTGEHAVEIARDARAVAVRRLASIDARYEALTLAPGLRRKPGWTLPEARGIVEALTAIHGSNWLAAEIAALGAVTGTTSVLERDRSSVPTSFATPLSIRAYIDQVRQHGHSTKWWLSKSQAEDPMLRALWCVGVVTYADPVVINEVMPLLNRIGNSLEESLLGPMTRTSSRISAHAVRYGTRRSVERVDVTKARGIARLLLGHRFGVSDDCPNSEIAELGRFGVAAWPLHELLMTRLASRRSTRELVEILRLFGPTVPLSGSSIAKLPKTRGRWVDDVLAEVGSYPAELVAATGSRMSWNLPLSEIAEQSKWFDFSW